MESLWTITFFLLLQGGVSGVEQNATGCQVWESRGRDVCCTACRPGNRLVRRCDMDPNTLCTPCEYGKYTEDPLAPSCKRCTQCLGAQVLLKECTISSDTQCGCDDRHVCGDQKCSFCVRKCGKGEEPEKRSCRPCSEGTFNDQIHQKCKPWSTQCPEAGQTIMADGNAFSDIKCDNISVTVKPVTPADPEDDATSLFLFVTLFMSVLVVFSALFIALAARRVLIKPKTLRTKTKKYPIVRTPTDDPRTLIAIECSFHEAEQEQGSSSESLASKDSEDPLVP